MFKRPYLLVGAFIVFVFSGIAETFRDKVIETLLPEATVGATANALQGFGVSVAEMILSIADFIWWEFGLGFLLSMAIFTFTRWGKLWRWIFHRSKESEEHEDGMSVNAALVGISGGKKVSNITVKNNQMQIGAAKPNNLDRDNCMKIQSNFEYKGNGFYLNAVWDDNQTHFITNSRFVDCDVFGPAVMGIFDPEIVEGCDIQVEGAIVIQPNRKMKGFIAFYNCEFIECDISTKVTLVTDPATEKLLIDMKAS